MFTKLHEYLSILKNGSHITDSYVHNRAQVPISFAFEWEKRDCSVFAPVASGTVNTGERVRVDW